MRNRVLALAWPAIIDQTLAMVVGMVDTAMVGRLGAFALASVGLGAQVMAASIAIFGAVTTGTTAVVARFIGAREPEAASVTARQSLLLGGALAATVAALLLLFGEQILRLLFGSSDPHVLDLAVVYVRIVALALVPQFLLIVVNGILRGSGDTRTPMRIMALVNSTNALFNYLLIFGIGPFPRLEVKGAAIATALALTLGGTVAIVSLARGKNGIQLLGGGFRPNLPAIKRVLTIGIPAGVEQIMMQTGQLIYTVIISSLGTVAYAAHRVALNAESLSFMPGFGFALAATTFVGQGLGAKDPMGAERSGREAARLAGLVMSGIGLFFFLFPQFFVSFFTDDVEVVTASSQVLRIVALGQPFLAGTMVFAGGLRGAGDTRAVLLITIVGVCVVRIGLAYILVRLGLGLKGAWLAMVADLVIRGLLLRIRFRKGAWKHLRI